MLSPIVSPPKQIEIVAYDLEWWPKTLKLRLCGVYDEDRGYRSYETIDDFLSAELTRENRGKYFFAHAGGRFDVQEVLERLAEDDAFEVSAHFSGGAAVIVTAKRGRDKWTFADSYFVLRDSLKKVGLAIGYEKGECAFDAPLEELRAYNERDCIIVYRALHMLRAELEALGGELRPTLAGCAMRLFRRAYLEDEIPTNENVNRVLRPAYCASRVEVFTPRAPKARYYDINSSFPFSMTKPQPGRLLKVRRKAPFLPAGDDAIYFADCDVQVDPQYLPPLPYRHGQRIFFPSGTWRGWFARPDLELLESYGGRILKVHRSYEFAPFVGLQTYVGDIYERKVEAEKAGDAFRRMTYKLLLNSLYGKFGERSDKKTILVNPASTSCPHKGEHPNDECLELIAPGIYQLSEEKSVPHAHLPIAEYVTSLSRSLLYQTLKECDPLYYADTDSAVTGSELPTGHELGALKLEGNIEDAHFVGAKVYAFTDRDSGKRVIKSKGFSRLDQADFEKLVAFEAVPIERMAGVKEGLRTNGKFGRAFSPVTEKRLHENVLPKRAPDGKGTRPWDLSELLRK